MCDPEGNSEFCFPESLNVPRDEVEGNIETRGKHRDNTEFKSVINQHGLKQMVQKSTRITTRHPR